jgi:hypothetical protein
MIPIKLSFDDGVNRSGPNPQTINHPIAINAGTVPNGNLNEILDFPMQQMPRGFLLQGLVFHFERRIEDRAIGLPLPGRSSRAGVP